RITDAYSLNGITPPVPPYSGRYSAPGPLIGDTPTRTATAIPGGALITGQANLDASLYELRLGPYLEVPLWRRLSLSLGGGATIAWIDSTFEFSETAGMADIETSLLASGRGSRGQFRFGGFVVGELSLALRKHLSIVTGVQYQYLGKFAQSVDN